MSIFQTARELPASPAAVFAAIRHPERLARWWGPAGFSNTFEQFEFHPGGQWKFTMHGPNGTNYANASEFTEIVPDVKVVIRHQSEPHFTLSITLSPSATGTLVEWVQAFDSPEVAAAVRHIVEPANEQNLDRLTAEVSAAKHGS
ncbi:SRPBCC family protein [Rhodoferax sp.]|uniref:SRPBCC family protein n=1 Tax=Rhodoferax sp. TaxID=50421 RepID=UPI00374DF845